MRFAGMLVALVIAVAAVHRPAAADADFLVDATWLEQHIEDPGLVLLEVRYHPHRHFSVGHIPGAVQVQRFRDLGDNDGVPITRFPSREAFQATLRRWGVNDDSTIVVYDDSRTALASRVYFLLDLYGFEMSRVKVMQGGSIEWANFNDMSKEALTPAPGGVTLKPARAELATDWVEVYDRVVSRRDPQVVLVDARPRDHYTGKEIVHSVRGGHIPGAVNIVSLDGTDGQTHGWKSLDEIATLYGAVPRDRTVFVYCHDGFRMSLAYMQLKALGYGDVRLYNGGWGHWGNELALPVVEGGEPLDEAFRL